MDNATLSLLNSPIFWTFFVLGILSLLGSMLVSYSPPKRRRYRDETLEAISDSYLGSVEKSPSVRAMFEAIQNSDQFTAKNARRLYRDEHEAGGIGA